MKMFPVFCLVATFSFASSTVRAETWAVGTATAANWGDTSSWVEGTVPNAVGATAIFNTPTVSTGTRNIDVNGNFTVGTVTFNNIATNSVTQNIRSVTTADTLKFDASGAGPVVITSSGNAATNTRIQSKMLFTDDVRVDVSNVVGNGTAGALSLTGDITGPGGLTKDGLGLLTTAFNVGLTSGLKEWAGPTIINNGRWRHSLGGAPTLTSGVTVNTGGQIAFITGGTLTYGANSDVPLNLNGFGPTAGPYAAFPGAFRPDSNLLVTLTNRILLQSDAMIHSNGTTAVMNLQNVVSGPGRLVAGSLPHDANVGKITLQSVNTYAGGTTVNVGTLSAEAASAFGTGGVQVVSAHSAFAGSQAHVLITGAAADAIANTAYLNLAGGNAADTADDGYIDLDAGVNEVVGGLMLGGVIYGPGTYGRSGNLGSPGNPGLANPNEYFAGEGIITVVAAGVPGDYNNNGLVDAGDYVVWRKGGTLANDFTPGVQPSDYDFWRSRFGASTNPGSGSGLVTSTVPEPSTISLTGCLVSLLIIGRRKGVLISHRETKSPFTT